MTNETVTQHSPAHLDDVARAAAAAASATSPYRLHLGCGTVYLDGYVNVDVHVPGYSFLAAERPDLAAANRTTADRYYKTAHDQTSLSEKRNIPQHVVVDRFMDITNPDVPENSVDEIRCVQVFEHLTRDDATAALAKWFGVLKPGGILHLDVPDFEETVRQLLAQDTEEAKDWYYRLVFGSQKNAWALHKDGHSGPRLARQLRQAGFADMRELENTIHFYPCVIMEARKPVAP